MAQTKEALVRNRIWMFLILTFSCAQLLPAQAQSKISTIEEILKLPEEQIDIGFASLVMAKEFYPNLNIEFFLYAFDYMAQRFNHYFGHLKSPEDRVRALNSYLYRKGVWNDSITFSYDDDDLHTTRLSNKFINGYIATKKGSCITMPLLYVILGERLGWPIHPVRSAKHFFIRYLNDQSVPNFQENIEATNGGGYLSNKQYQEDVLIPEKAIKNGVFLKTLPKKEYLASLLLTNANEYIASKNIDKAKQYLLLAMKYDSTFSSAYWNYGLIHFAIAREIEEKMENEQQAAITYFQALEIGDRNAQSYAPITPKTEPVNNPVSEIISKPPQPFEFERVDVFSQDRDRIPQPPATNPKANPQRHVPSYSNDLQQTLMDIEREYAPSILANLDIYRKYRNKAEELGVVREFPTKFFLKQAESIKKFKEKGGY